METDILCLWWLSRCCGLLSMMVSSILGWPPEVVKISLHQCSALCPVPVWNYELQCNAPCSELPAAEMMMRAKQFITTISSNRWDTTPSVLIFIARHIMKKHKICSFIWNVHFLWVYLVCLVSLTTGAVSSDPGPRIGIGRWAEPASAVRISFNENNLQFWFQPKI